MSKMTLVLHIGTEKTGTTLIQKWLYQNRGRFLENGIYLSNSLGWENNRSLVAYFRSEPDEFWTFNGIKNKEQKEQFFASFLTDLEAEIEQASANNHTMVITSEHFHSRLTDENDVATFSDFCRRNFKDHVVVCYLRPQWDVRKSIYSTDLRNNESRRFSQYRSDISASDKYFDYLNLYRRWKRNFAYAQIEFRNYDRSSFIGNDLRKDFASVFPIAIDVNDFEFSDKRENESLALLESAAYAAVNRAVPLFEGQSVNKRNYEYKKLLSDLRVLKRGTLADPLSHKVYDTFKDSNNELFDEVFSGKDVFGYPREEAGEQTKVSLEEVSDIVERLVETMVRYLDAKIPSPQEIDSLRDIALGFCDAGAERRLDAIKLLEIAARVRPDGQIIKNKLVELKAGVPKKRQT